MTSLKTFNMLLTFGTKKDKKNAARFLVGNKRLTLPMTELLSF